MQTEKNRRIQKQDQIIRGWIEVSYLLQPIFYQNDTSYDYMKSYDLFPTNWME